MNSIYRGNNISYFKDFDYKNLFSQNLETVIENKFKFYYQESYKSHFLIKDKYCSLPIFIRTNNKNTFFEKTNENEEQKFLKILENIENDLQIKLVFCFLIKSYNKTHLCHSHIGYNYKFDRNLYTMKYILDYHGDRSSYFFCEKDYIKFNNNDVNKWYFFKTFKPHFFFNNDKNFNERHEFVFYFYKKDFYEKNEKEYYNYINNFNVIKTNFKSYMIGDIDIQMMPKYFLFKKNKKKIIL